MAWIFGIVSSLGENVYCFTHTPFPPLTSHTHRGAGVRGVLDAGPFQNLRQHLDDDRQVAIIRAKDVDVTRLGTGDGRM